MLSYQHTYHAGNFADVLKHTALTCVLDYLLQKDKPLFYLETHAGRGVYDLDHAQAKKTGESKSGIELLWKQRQSLPPVFSHYLQAISEVNSGERLRYYPGSPSLAVRALRPQDRATLCELHPKEFEYLSKLPCQGKKVYFSEADGLQQLTACLPPAERRGLVLIDPSYEIKTEYRDIPQRLKTAYQQFETGCYVLWYPLLDKKLQGQLIRGLEAIKATKHLRLELYQALPTGSGMTGCGLWVINPPYVLASQMKTVLQTLTGLFQPGVSSFLIES